MTWGELNQLPMTTADATGKEWVQNSADDCTNGGEFNGYRWINPKDMGLSLLFDVNGHVGGLQVLVLTKLSCSLNSGDISCLNQL